MHYPKVLLGPMAGITNAAMRAMCIRYGAPLATTEMISAHGLLYRNVRTEDLLLTLPEEKQVIVQLFGRDPAALADAAQNVQEKAAGRLFGIDLNMGCPAPKIFRNGEGSALLLEPDLAASIVRSVKNQMRPSASGEDLPLSVKIRTGVKSGDLDLPAFCKMLEDSGADRICVHGRTRSQYYSGTASLEAIRTAVQAVSIPVTGNGDIFSAQDALRMFEQTGCDAVMVARGAIGRPYIFSEIDAALAGRDIPPEKTDGERLDILCEHMRLVAKTKGERFGIPEMRAQIPKYLKGMRGASAMRAKLNTLGTLSDILEAVQEYSAQLAAEKVAEE